MPKIYKCLDLPKSDTGFIYRQDNNSDMLIYAIQDGHVVQFKLPVVQGTYSSTDYLPQEIETFQYDLTHITGDLLEDYVLFLFKNNKGINIAMYPAVTDKFVYDDAYRLYWGYDTKKLYMNICNSWEMIGTLRHELMENIGTLSHDEIEAKLAEIEQALGNISSAVVSINGLKGDITLAQGNNVTITEDEATKSINIEAKDTITTVNSLKGSVILEAGDNVTISQPTGTNKLVISASGGGSPVKTEQNLTVSNWSPSSRRPKVFGGIYTFKKDVEISAINIYDTINTMTDAVVLVYRQIPYDIVRALITDTSSTTSYFIDVATAPPSQYIPLADIASVSIKVNAGEPLAILVYSPAGYTPVSFSYGGYDTNDIINKARCMVASDGSTTAFITAGDGYPETYSLTLKVKI